MKQIIKTILLSFCAIGFFSNNTLAQSTSVPGPPMFCGKKDKLITLSQRYNETEFMVLQEDKTSERPYYILYRNEKSGAWTFVVYNIPNAPSEFICVLSGGLSSYILPDLNSIKKMLKKQKDGLDEPKKNNDSTS